MLDVKSDWTDIGEPDADTVAKLNEIFAPKPEIRDAAYYRRKWVEAARSGRYQQTGGQLRIESITGPTFCILGLACEVVREASNGAWLWNDDDEFVRSGWQPDRDDHGEAYELPEEVAEIFGLECKDAWYEDSDGHRRSLVGQNDDGKTFAELADIIESEPPGLLK